MVITPLDITKILQAAAPIAASVASIANNKSEVKEKEIKQEPIKINVTVNNTFYTRTENESVALAEKLQEKVIDEAIQTGSRYLL